MNKNNIAVIFCLPLSRYPVLPPSDVSKCEKVKCPICNNDMWFSIKKKAFKKQLEESNRKPEIFFGYCDCFEKFVINNPGIMDDHVRIDI